MFLGFKRSRCRSTVLFVMFVLAVCVGGASSLAQTTQPATPLPDPSGYNGGPTETLFQPNSYLSGWATGVGEDDGSGGLKSWKPYANPDAPTPAELSKNIAKAFYSINFVWVLVSGFLVMFMQAGFALVETGLCRAKNAAHTMWMNFMVYPLGMFGFFRLRIHVPELGR